MLKVGVIVSWKFNQTYIAENLCINKNKPEMKCDGKCHLQKQLKSIEDKSDTEKDASLPLKLKNLDGDNFVTTSDLFVHSLLEVTSFSMGSILNNLYSFDYKNTCFKPPQV